MGDERADGSGESSGDLISSTSASSTTALVPSSPETGSWLLISIGIYLVAMLVIVLYCLQRRGKSDCSCLPADFCMGQCSCLDACNCQGSLPSLTDCCPQRNPNEPSCFDLLQCNCEPDEVDPDPCCETGFMLGDCCKCQPSEEEIIQRRMAQDPDYFIKMMQANPQFQRSLREQTTMNQFQQNTTLTSQPTSARLGNSLGNQPTWSTINGSTGRSARLQTLSTDNASYT